MRRVLFILILSVMLLISLQVSALTLAFNDCEVISYQFYFNWKFVWIKAATATMTTHPPLTGARKYFSTAFVKQTSREIDRFFVMRDTITGFCNLDLGTMKYN